MIVKRLAWRDLARDYPGVAVQVNAFSGSEQRVWGLQGFALLNLLATRDPLAHPRPAPAPPWAALRKNPRTPKALNPSPPKTLIPPPPPPPQGGTLKWQNSVILDPTTQFANFALYAPSINFYQTRDPHSPTGFVQSGTVFTASAGPSNNLPSGTLGTGGVIHGFRADTGAPVMNVFYTGSYCSDIMGLAIQGTVGFWGLTVFTVWGFGLVTVVTVWGLWCLQFGGLGFLRCLGLGGLRCLRFGGLGGLRCLRFGVYGVYSFFFGWLRCLRFGVYGVYSFFFGGYGV